MSLTHIFSGLFFVLTAVCLFLAERYRGHKIAQHAAKGALGFVVVAGLLFVGDVPVLGALTTPSGHKAKKPAQKKQGGGQASQAAAEEDEAEPEGAGPAASSSEGAASDPAAPKSTAGKSGMGGGGADVPSQPQKTAALAAPADKTDDGCDSLPEMVQIEAGTGHIGAPANEASATSAEKPERAVRIWPSFKISRNEIAFREYKCFVEATGRPWTPCPNMPTPIDTKAGAGKGPHLPATCVSWEDAKAYAAWLSKKSGTVFRLPTAQQWEYAARSGESAGQDGGTGPAAALRVENMGGGVAEFVVDCWVARSKPASGAQDDIDQTNLHPDTCGTHMLKDGAAGEAPQTRQPWSRRRVNAGVVSAGIGFRIVQTQTR